MGSLRWNENSVDNPVRGDIRIGGDRGLGGVGGFGIWEALVGGLEGWRDV
jgi:hypothetical protein